MMTYDDFKDKIASTIRTANRQLTWTEIRTMAALPQAFPNNQWVHRMETDIGLIRRRESDGTVLWSLKEPTLDFAESATTQIADQASARPRGK